LCGGIFGFSGKFWDCVESEVDFWRIPRNYQFEGFCDKESKNFEDKKMKLCVSEFFK